ncbi:hypothetical protein E8E12_007740 [Didymella heteroderae]|uniref:Uncharacterized protein n=1 Tax=Didymella heteroderae TaxID=1769908 RepID=A0A9P4WLZ5_9PLEO|nr:hypothetical protein E8E12_007740 [Didymella heteroderae]
MSGFKILPRELRDQIYEYLLGPDSIAIECAVTNVPRSLVAVGGEIGFCEALYQKYKLTYPLAHRSTWEVPVKNLNVLADEFQLDSTTVTMTYQIGPSLRESTGAALELQLLEVCQQIHAEATTIFYTTRQFCFNFKYAIPTAAAFLADRSTDALSSINFLQLSLFEARGGAIREGDYPIDDVSLLRDTYGYFPKLCGFYATYFPGDEPDELPSLEHFNTNGFGGATTIWSDPPQHKVPSWVDPLLKITGLETLKVSLRMTAPGLQNELEAVLMMRRCMVKGCEQLTNADELEFRHVICSESSPNASGQLVRYNPGTGTIRWLDDVALSPENGENTFAPYHVFRLCTFIIEGDHESG